MNFLLSIFKKQKQTNKNDIETKWPKFSTVQSSFTMTDDEIGENV